ncbi:hypothetical protein QFC21_002572 [Naganishia friedmannii]|uniref:Uncharacterized protein n=1 Tax=Naganishia friedmannii TaxID=89922 RepID=A0ACC2VUN3_9TREE|nr:hypothetical protein QFC21_002572 [Naganishia friedmannii]
MLPPKSILNVLTTLAILSTAANAAAFDTHQQGNRGLVHRHRQHQQARAASGGVQFLPRAGAAYNQTDHDTSASIEIGGEQTAAKTSAVATPTVATTSAVISTSATSTPVSSSVSSSPAVSVPVSTSSSVISSATLATSATSAVNPTVVVTSSQLVSSSSIASSSSSSLADSLTVASSTSSSTSSSSSSSTSDPVSTSVVSTVQTVTDTAANVIVTATPSTVRGAKTGSVVIKTATASSSASAAAASGGSSSGISGGTKIGIIVASVVGGVALGAFVLWTIIRKVKFKPTDKFAVSIFETRAGRTRIMLKCNIPRQQGRLVAIDLSPASDPFYEKTRRRFSLNSANSGSSADRQRRQFVEELDDEQYGQHVQHAQQYDMAGLPGANDTHGVPSHDFTAGAAPYYSHGQPAYEHQGYDDDAGYVDLRRGPSLINGQQTSPTTFAGVGAGGAGLPSMHGGGRAVSPINAYASEQHYANYSPPQDGLAREPSLGRPTRGDGPYAAAAPHFASPGSRY